MPRFNTVSNPFLQGYAEQAILQKGFNYQIIEDIVQYVLRKLPWVKTRPISIMDVCCGDGAFTYHLLKEFDKNGMLVNKIAGLDISPQQIERAKIYEEKDNRLKFVVDNIEELNCTEEYDVVVSLFGLHWVENIHSTAERISRALKPHGLMVFFVPLEKNELFALRNTLMRSDAWRETFKDFNINPFFDTSAPYISAFAKHFLLENQQGITGDQPVYFSETDFIKFLSSWMQEVRYLKSTEKAEQYLNSLVNVLSISEEKANVDVIVSALQDRRQICLFEKFFWFHGTKKTVPEEKKCEKVGARILSKL